MLIDGEAKSVSAALRIADFNNKVIYIALYQKQVAKCFTSMKTWKIKGGIEVFTKPT